MNTGELKSIIEDIEFATEKLLSLEHIGELAESLKNLENNLSGFKKISSKNFFISGLVGLLIGGFIGWLTVKSYAEYQVTVIQSFKNTKVLVDGLNTYLYIPKENFVSQRDGFIIFQQNKIGE